MNRYERRANFYSMIHTKVKYIVLIALGIIISAVSLINGVSECIRVSKTNSIVDQNVKVEATVLKTWSTTSRSRTSIGKKTVYHASVEYKYDGVTYKNSNIKLSSKHEEGDTVNIYVDAHDPSNSVSGSVSNNSWFSFLLVAVGVGLIAIGFFLKKGYISDETTTSTTVSSTSYGGRYGNRFRTLKEEEEALSHYGEFSKAELYEMQIKQAENHGNYDHTRAGNSHNTSEPMFYTSYEQTQNSQGQSDDEWSFLNKQ